MTDRNADRHARARTRKHTQQTEVRAVITHTHTHTAPHERVVKRSKNKNGVVGSTVQLSVEARAVKRIG